MYETIDKGIDKTIDNTFKYSSDVAILTLEKALKFSPKINPICLPSDAESKQTYVGKEATVAGWGITESGKPSEEQQLQVKVPIIGNSNCQTFYHWIKRFIKHNLYTRTTGDLIPTRLVFGKTHKTEIKLFW